jgi:hypothetical protein
MPAILFKTATKQLHDGYKAARDRLSAGSSGSGSKTSSFTDRGVSRTASFNSSSSDVKPRSLKGEKFPTVHEVSKEFDGGDSSPQSVGKNGVKDDCQNVSSNGHYNTTSPAKAKLRNVLFKSPHESSNGTTESNHSKITTGLTSLLGSNSMSSGISALLSPKSTESGGSTLSHIAGMLHLNTFKRTSFDSQGSGSLGHSSLEDSDNNERDMEEHGHDSKTGEIKTKKFLI